MLSFYLGPKGYTILKKDLSREHQDKIRTDLTIQPFSLNPSEDKKYFAYRESLSKFYIPHYYGIEHFGKPRQYKISEGIDINVPFNGKVYANQEVVLHKFITNCLTNGYGGGLLELHTGWGKTIGALKIISELGKKTIIVVHKKFLMNQFLEQIELFLPTARIGFIQGPVVDIKDKDIVICMLQSLISKDYDQSIFDEFGLTIIDEVHHISSQSFSNALFKLVTKYMLGLSATMTRKDGTTDVFKLFLGDVIHKAERKTDMVVEVRAVTYKVDDPEFNDTILDYRGKVQNSSMISKICEYSYRTEFIIKTLCDFIQVSDICKEEMVRYKQEMDEAVPTCKLCGTNRCYLVKTTCCNCIHYCFNCMNNAVNNVANKRQRCKCPECKKILKFEPHYVENKYIKPFEEVQVIVMAQNLNILHYIYNKLVSKNLASVGYYVGGMSQQELKKTESKQIVLSSYQMASEGLNIPSLNAEFLITPKTDIVQSVGRILRAKHAHSHPIIYDFVDSHSLFQRQWAKRKSYYKKQNYKIVSNSNITYNTNYATWKTVYEPSTSTSTSTSAAASTLDKSIIESDEDNDEDEDDVTDEICMLL